jgi:hypothetical protein
MQGTPDLFLGWHDERFPDGTDISFDVRQLHDNKASVTIERLTPTTLSVYAKVWRMGFSRERTLAAVKHRRSPGTLGKVGAI